MKTPFEKSDQRKNGVIAVLLIGILGTGLVAYHYAEKSRDLETVFLEEKADIKQHLLDTYAEIEQNLNQISAHEGVLKSNLNEGENNPDSNPEKRIQREIEIIAALMDRNNHLIAGLNAQVGAQDKQLKSYQSRIGRMNQKIKQYRQEADELIAANQGLRSDLDAVAQKNMKLITSIDSTTYAIRTQREVIDAQQKTLNDKETEINRSYYAVGDFQELRENDVLEKEGGILGVGAIKSLKDNLDPAKFTCIDRRNYTTIPVFSKKAELVTSHDTSSYELQRNAEGVVQWVKITNPEVFWKNSKYCVIVKGNDHYEYALAN